MTKKVITSIYEKGKLIDFEVEVPIQDSLSTQEQIIMSNVFNQLTNGYNPRDIGTSWAMDCIYEMRKKVSLFDTLLYDNKKKSQSYLGTQVKDHEFLTLIRKSNQYGQGWNTLHELITHSIILYGRAYIYVFKDNLNRPIGFFLLPENSVQLMKVQGGLQIQEFKIKGFETPIRPDENRLILITDSSLNDPYCGDPIINRVINYVDRDNLQQNFQKKVYENFGAVGLVIEFEDKLTGDDLKFYREMLSQYRIDGSRDVGSSLAIGNKGKIKSMSSNFKDLDFTNTRKDIREEIFAKFKIPAEMFGIFNGNYSNSDKAVDYYIKNTVVPFSRQITDAFTSFVRLQWGEQYTVVYDYPDQISERDIELFKAMDASSRFSTNECREILNQGSIEGGDVIPSLIQNNSGSLNNGK